jgi:hypothetical protein
MISAKVAWYKMKKREVGENALSCRSEHFPFQNAHLFGDHSTRL